MAEYPRLSSLLLGMGDYDRASYFAARVVPYLVEQWLDEYWLGVQSDSGLAGRSGTAPAPDIVETTTNSGFSYLFDVAAERLIAAWGISKGKNTEPRPASRMKAYPLGTSARHLYHRGHAIPHTLGGETDINLVPQLGKINVGPFRELEIRAVGHPGSFYFTYWRYVGSRPVLGKTGQLFPGQVPTGVDQGLLIPGQAPMITHHVN